MKEPKIEFDDIIGMHEVTFFYYGKRCHSYFTEKESANNFKRKISK